MLTRICSPEGWDEMIRRQVAAGRAKFLNPRDLHRLGLDDYIREMPPENLALWKRVDSGQVLEVVEPFMGRWLQFRDFYQRECIDRVLRPSGKNFDYKAALRSLERDANSGIMFERPASAMNRYRNPARLIAGLILAMFCVFVLLIVRDRGAGRGSEPGSTRAGSRGCCLRRRWSRSPCGATTR